MTPTRGSTRAIGSGPFKSADPMTEAEYQAQLAALDAERAALEQTFITSQAYPRWAYHATEPAHLVDSDAEALALGAGWSPTPLDPPPPVVTALEPDTVVLGSPSFTLHVLGTGFDAEAVIVFAGQDEPTTHVSATEVTTGVDMAFWAGPDALPVLVRNGDGQASDPQTFTFTEAAALVAAKASAKARKGPA